MRPERSTSSRRWPKASGCRRSRPWPAGRRCSRATSTRCPRRSEEHTSELQSLRHLVCRLLLEKKKHKKTSTDYRRRDNETKTNDPDPYFATRTAPRLVAPTERRSSNRA